MNEIFATRLKQARVMRGLSMDELVRKTGNVLSKQSVSKYEAGKMMPDSTILIALSNALEMSLDYFFRPLTVEIDNIEFRKKSRLGVKQIESIKEVVKDRLERYFEIESITDTDAAFRHPYSNVKIEGEDDVFPIVARIKNDWKIGEDGINNLIEVLEENRIKVIEIDAPASFDGLSGYVSNSIPVVVLNKNFASERKRFTALHELGHLLLSFDASTDNKRVEKLCNLFASEMLISREAFIQKIGERRADISLQELKTVQEQFGISIDALMYKARYLNIITENRYKTFQKKKHAVTDFRASVEKNRTKPEVSTRFDRLVYRALASEIISISKASVLLGCPINEVRNRLALV